MSTWLEAALVDADVARLPVDVGGPALLGVLVGIAAHDGLLAQRRPDAFR